VTTGFMRSTPIARRFLLAGVAGLASAVGAYFSAKHLDEEWQAAADALLQAAVVVVVGIGIAAVLDRRAALREARQRSAARKARLDRIAAAIELAGTGWVNMPRDPAAQGSAASVPSGIDAINEQCETLAKIARQLREAREASRPGDETAAGILLIETWSASSSYWFEGARRLRFRYLAGLREVLQAEHGSDDALRERYVAFASALDLAEAAAGKTDAVVEARLVATLVGATNDLAPYRPLSPDVAAPVGAVAQVAAGAIDPVLHLALASDALTRAIPAEPFERWAADVLKAVDRCVGALVHEVTNVQLALIQLRELVGELESSR
jgi:hypothetical protein